MTLTYPPASPQSTTTRRPGRKRTNPTCVKPSRPLSDIEIMLDWADEAVAAAATVVERARGADPKAKNEIDAIVSALNAIRCLFAGARGSFETIPVIAN
jgi:hypothetical protein